MKRGFTLVEVMLGGTLSLLLAGLFLLILLPLLRYTQWSSSRASLVESANLALERLGGDLRTSPLTGIALPNAQRRDTLSIHGLGSTSDSGLAVGESFLRVYRWDLARGTLTRGLWYPLGHDLLAGPFRPGDAELAASLPHWSQRGVLISNLKEIHLSLSSGDDNLPLRVQLVTELPLLDHPPERFSLTRFFALRNGGR